MTHQRCAAFTLLLLLLAPPVAHAADNSNWGSGFHPPGVRDGNFPGTVNAVAANNGQVYIGGSFSEVGAVEARNVARWDGHHWHAMGTGIGGDVISLYAAETAVFASGWFSEAGGEPALFVARWDGADWHRMGGSDFNGIVNGFAYYNGGLYACGRFSEYGGSTMPLVAHWAGSDWERLSGGNLTCYHCYPAEVIALAAWDGKLWAGGRFDYVNPWDLNGLAYWTQNDGWQSVDGDLGVSGGDDAISCFEAHNYSLYFGGPFAFIGFDPCQGFGYVFGGTLHTIAGLDPWNYWVTDLLEYNAALYVVSEEWIRPWLGVGGWGEELGELDGAFAATTEHGDLYAGGTLFYGNTHIDGLARWDGDGWRRVGEGLGFSANNSDQGRCLLSWEGDLFMGGYQTGVRGIGDDVTHCANVGLFNGDDWLPLAGGFVDAVEDAIIYDGQLHVCGAFDHEAYGGNSIYRLARWDGAAWQPLATGLNPGTFVGHAYAMTLWQGDLIVGGNFESAGGLAVDNLARWNGTAFSAVDDALFSGEVRALCVYAGDLIVGGTFVSLDGQAVGRIARWDGAAWDFLDGGMGDGVVEVLEVWQGQLIAGGSFTTAGGVPAARIARWDGSAWQALDAGLGGADFVTTVRALQPSDIGLFVGGRFETAGGQPAANIARWQAGGWEPLGDGVTEGYLGQTVVDDFCIHDGQLYLTGDFLYAGGHLSANIAHWREALTPVTLLRFDLIAEPGSVRANWELAEGEGPVEQRLEAARGGEVWQPAIEPLGGGSFQACDLAAPLAAGGSFNYRLSIRESGGDWQLLRQVAVQVPPLTPTQPTLAAWPNPGAAIFTIQASLPAPGAAELAVFDVGGRRLATLHRGRQSERSLQLTWDGRDDGGRPLPAGVYLLRLRTATGQASQRLALLR